MKTEPVLTYYLEMKSPPSKPNVKPPGVSVVHFPKPKADLYRWLYESVGGSLRWFERLMIPQAKLQALLDDPLVEVHVLKIHGVAGGYVEFDRRTPGQVEIAYFGLFPEFIGRGLGEWFLSWAASKAWDFEVERVWLHTCEHDHPAALPTYQKAGFVIYDQRIVDEPVPGSTDDATDANVEVSGHYDADNDAGHDDSDGGDSDGGGGDGD